MDNVKITLQNKELIEQIINSTDNLEVTIHNAIIDAITKRFIKNIENSEIIDKKLKEAMKKVEDEVSQKYLRKEKSQWGYSTEWKLNPEYETAVVKAVKNAYSNLIDEKVKELVEPFITSFKTRLEGAIGSFEGRIDEYAKRAVQDAVEKRFGKP